MYHGETRFVVQSDRNTIWANQIETASNSTSTFGGVTVTGALNVQGTDVLALLAQLASEVTTLRSQMRAVLNNCSCAAGIPQAPPPPPPPATTMSLPPASTTAQPGTTSAGSAPLASTTSAVTAAIAGDVTTAAPAAPAAATSGDPAALSTGAATTSVPLLSTTAAVVTTLVAPAVTTDAQTTGAAPGTTGLPVTTASNAAVLTTAAAFERTVPAAPYGTGYNNVGQLGRTLGFDSSVPVAVTRTWSNYTSITRIRTGVSHTLYLSENGTAYAVGLNTNGQCGDGTYLNNWTPVAVQRPWGAAVQVITIGAGSWHSAFALSNGRVYTTGDNSYGQLATGDTSVRNTPTMISQPWSLSIKTVKLCGGDYHTLFLLENGQVYAAGYNPYGQLGDYTITNKLTPVLVGGSNPPWGNAPVTDIACGGYHSVVLAYGLPYAVGRNTNGQLGVGNIVDQTSLQAVQRAWGQVVVTAISANQYTTLFLLESGNVWATGYNGYGAMGDGTNWNRNVSVQVMNTWGTQRIAAVSAGTYHSVFLTNNGSVYSSGYNVYGALGDGTTTQRLQPVLVTPPSTQGRTPIALAIATGQYHTVINYDNVYRTGGGSEFSYPVSMTTGMPFPTSGPRLAYACGNGGFGQVADGFGIDRSTLRPVVASWGSTVGIASVAALNYFTVFETENGTAWAAGQNGDGQHGDGTTRNNFVPTRVLGLGTGTVAVVGGSYYSAYFALSNGSVFSVGNNAYGQLGDGTAVAKTTPVKVQQPWSAAIPVVQIEGGSYHAVFLLANGLVYAVGLNSNYQLGDGSGSNRAAPYPVTQAWGNAFVTQITCGQTHTLVLTTNGLVYAVGSNGNGQLGVGDNSQRSSWTLVVRNWGSVPVSYIASNTYHSAFVVAGEVWATGYNGYGQLGCNDYTQRTSPVAVSRQWSASLNVTSIAVGQMHTLYRLSSGQVYGAGMNTNGQLGDNTFNNRPLPVAMAPAFAGANAVAISAGAYHSVVLYDNYAPATVTTSVAATTAAPPAPPTPVPRSVFSYGYNNVGQLGEGLGFDRYRMVPVRPAWSSSAGIAAVSMGMSHTVMLADDGLVYATGLNTNGQCGDGTYLNNWSPAAVQRPWGAAVRVTVVGTGSWHSAFALSNGRVYTTGDNSYGQLATGDTSVRNTPTMISQPWSLSVPVVQICGGDYHTVIVLGNGQAYSAGYNAYGQLGDYTTANKLTPVLVGTANPPWGNAPVHACACGGYHTLILSSNGLVYAVGRNTNGQLGIGTILDQNTFQAVSVPWGQVTVSSISANQYTSFFLLSTGDVWATGYNGYGALGDGTNWNRNVSVAVSKPWAPSAVVVQVAAGTYHTLFRLSDGRVFASGYNVYGMVGDATTTQRLLPVESLPPTIQGITPFALSIAAGQYHSAVTYATVYVPGSTTGGAALPSSTTSTVPLASLRLAYAFGANSFGQIGDGTAVERRVPVPVRRPWGNNTGFLWSNPTGDVTMHVSADGVPYSTGSNSNNQIGDGTSLNAFAPTAVQRPWGTTQVAYVGGGRYHSHFVLTGNVIYSVGNNAYGQLGDGTTLARSVPVVLSRPWAVGDLVAQICGGSHHSMFRLVSGLVYGVGLNSNYQLGDGSGSNRATPYPVTQAWGNAVIQDVACGGTHTLVLASNGLVYGVGSNGNGQLGVGDNSQRSSWTLMQRPFGNVAVIAVESWEYHSLVLLVDGTVWSTGYNGYGQLGCNDYTQRTSPVAVSTPWGGSVKVSGIAAGTMHSLALLSTGQVYAWGMGTNGQLGVGNTNNYPTPMPITAPPFAGANATHIAAGNYHSTVLYG